MLNPQPQTCKTKDVYLLLRVQEVGFGANPPQPPFASRPKTETTAGPRNSETLNPQPQSCETEPLPLRHPARKGFLGCEGPISSFVLVFGVLVVQGVGAYAPNPETPKP